MTIERITGTAGGKPFPVYQDLVSRLLAAHFPGGGGRDATVAHVLGTCSGYAYGDLETVATTMARLGLEGCACVRIARTVDAMFIFSTAYLVQSPCGRLLILCYRGTEPTNLGNWVGDADVGSDSLTLGGESLSVHAGFHRNARATRWAVLQELELAVRGKSLLDPRQSVDHPAEALYITGHSLGGAMAVLFALSLIESAEPGARPELLRAIYTFGQPLVIGEPLPVAAGELARKLFRHVAARDPVPALPPAAWGRLAHFGEEYCHADGDWRRSPTAVAQLENVRDLPLSLLALLAPAKRRENSRYSMAEHTPHHYLEALRPAGMITEFGDFE